MREFSKIERERSYQITTTTYSRLLSCTKKADRLQERALSSRRLYRGVDPRESSNVSLYKPLLNGKRKEMEIRHPPVHQIYIVKPKLFATYIFAKVLITSRSGPKIIPNPKLPFIAFKSSRYPSREIPLSSN